MEPVRNRNGSWPTKSKIWQKNVENYKYVPKHRIKSSNFRLRSYLKSFFLFSVAILIRIRLHYKMANYGLKARTKTTSALWAGLLSRFLVPCPFYATPVDSSRLRKRFYSFPPNWKATISARQDGTTQFSAWTCPVGVSFRLTLHALHAFVPAWLLLERAGYSKNIWKLKVAHFLSLQQGTYKIFHLNLTRRRSFPLELTRWCSMGCLKAV